MKIGDRYHKLIDTKTIPRVYKIINSALSGKYQQRKQYRESDKEYMKTFTNFATKAKQFLNLLQGYTKGIRFTAILILLLMGVSNAWAADVAKNAVIYMDNSAANWTYSNIYFVINSNGYPMSEVTNTKL